MSDKSSGSVGGGIGFVGLLTILFIGLKLTGHVSWSWWWVLSPLWIVVLVVVLCVLAVIAGALVYEYTEKKRKQKLRDALKKRNN